MKTKKAMKKITHIGMAALVAMGMLGTSCNKAESPEIETPETQKENIVTLTTTVGFAADGTKALAADGKKTFAEGETMAIYYWKNKGNDHEKAVSAPLTAGDITNGGKSATFTFTLTNPDKTKNVDYIYPAAIVNPLGNVNESALFGSQDGTLNKIASTFDYSRKIGAWDGDNLPSLTLENQLAILAITLKNADGSSDITSSITGLTLSDGTKTYNVSRSAAAGPIYVAIFPTAEATITVTATDGTKNYTKTLTTKTYTASNGYPVSWRMAEVVKPDLLSGVFSVSGSKTVKFSKGNLQATYDGSNWTWAFAANQWDYIGNAAGNTMVTATSPFISENATVDLFGWVGASSNWTGVNKYGITSSSATNNKNGYGNVASESLKSDWGTLIGSGWRTLSMAEWTYLLSTRTVNGGKGADKSYTLNQSVNGKRGMVIYPDNYTGAVYSGSNWASFEAAGCVFLPAAGWRDGTTINNSINDRGYYWSTTPSNAPAAKRMFFAGGLELDGDNSRAFGFSVRLVREVE